MKKSSTTEYKLSSSLSAFSWDEQETILPDHALENFKVAVVNLKGDELIWAKNHIAFAYQKKQAATVSSQGLCADAYEFYLEAMLYLNEVIEACEERKDEAAVKMHTFACCTRGLAKYNNGELDEAIKSYREALHLYEAHNLLDNPYARAKNCYAQLLALKGECWAANVVFVALEGYWQAKEDASKPYQLEFYMAYAEYLAANWPLRRDVCLDKYEKACALIPAVYGDSSPQRMDVLERITAIKNKQSAFKGAATLFHHEPVIENEVESNLNLRTFSHS